MTNFASGDRREQSFTTEGNSHKTHGGICRGFHYVDCLSLKASAYGCEALK